MNDVIESPPHGRPRLLPRLGVLGVMNVVASVISHFPFAFVGIIVLSTGYLAVVILMTRDLMSNVATPTVVTRS